MEYQDIIIIFIFFQVPKIKNLKKIFKLIKKMISKLKKSR